LLRLELIWTGLSTCGGLLFCSGPCFWPRFSVLAFLYLDTPALFAALWQPKSVAPNAISSAGIWVKLQQIKYNSAGGSDCDSHAKESGLGANHYYFYGVLQSGKKKRNPTETEANSGVQTSTSHPTTEIINSIKMPCNWPKGSGSGLRTADPSRPNKPHDDDNDVGIKPIRRRVKCPCPRAHEKFIHSVEFRA